MKTEILNLSANFRNLGGEMRGSGPRRTPCSDYVNERKLIRKIKSLINDDVIEKLSKIKKLGARKKTKLKRLLEIVEYKVTKLDGEKVKDYIERVESSNVHAYIGKIIRERKQGIFDKRRRRTV